MSLGVVGAASAAPQDNGPSSCAKLTKADKFRCKAGGPAPSLVYTVTTVETLTDRAMRTIVANCDPGDAVADGYALANGTPIAGNPAVWYSLGVTGTTPTGYQAVVGANTPPVTLTVVATCLDTAAPNRT
ncbi:hypothetical protein GCM10023215_21020 [Pseudonocardia yuanmonensis]|uniref:Ig-like domain-containing protein n=1 Tax=Pseudonocardia yuanmonensis TaxID=1095914 RepID=A0ABP8WAN2_9PSEU